MKSPFCPLIRLVEITSESRYFVKNSLKLPLSPSILSTLIFEALIKLETKVLILASSRLAVVLPAIFPTAVLNAPILTNCCSIEDRYSFSLSESPVPKDILFFEPRLFSVSSNSVRSVLPERDVIIFENSSVRSSVISQGFHVIPVTRSFTL